LTAVLAIFVLGAGIWISHGLETPSFSRLATLDLPVVARWRELGEWDDARRPVYIGAAAEGSGRYGRDGFEVAVYLAHYAAQAQGHEVVYYANRPQGEAAAIVSQTTVGVPSRDEQFAELEVTDGDAGRRLVWLQLRVAGRSVVGELRAKLWQAAGASLGRRDADALVLSADCGEDCSRARAGLTEFARDAVDALYAVVGPSHRTSGGER
jgi:EpsI family protein